VVTARQQVARTEVRAPFDGVVSERKVSVGDTVQVGRAHQGDRPGLHALRGPGQRRPPGRAQGRPAGGLPHQRFRRPEFHGKLSRIDASANATTPGRGGGRLQRPAKAPQVAGLYAEGRVERRPRALVLAEARCSARATTPSSGTAGRRAEEGGRAARRARRPRGEIEILGGLAVGDEVLRAPGGNLSDGQKAQRVAPGAGAASALASAK
jgi:pyruvate/2-oxoglutarate dehydrogenase complex dihydrolipoamide acyltransferase (E2) component